MKQERPSEGPDRDRSPRWILREAELAIVGEVLREVDRARDLHPKWPAEDPIHGTGIAAEELLELLQAALQSHYGDGDPGRIREEALHLAATAFRMLLTLGPGEPSEDVRSETLRRLLGDSDGSRASIRPDRSAPAPQAADGLKPPLRPGIHKITEGTPGDYPEARQ